MTAGRVRVTATVVELDTEPLRARHWAVIALVLLAGIAAWWLGADRLGGTIGRALRPAVSDDRDRIWTLATTRAPHAPVLLLGTSAMLENVHADSQLSREAGLDVVNLSVAGQSVVEALYTLYLAELRRGQLVVVMFTPNELASDQGIDRLASGLWEGPVPAFAAAVRDDVPGMAEWPGLVRRHEITWAIQRRMLYRATHDRVRGWAARHLYGDARPPWTQFRHDIAAPGNLEILANNRRILQRGLRYGFEANRRENARLMGVLLRFIQARGAHAVLLGAPRIEGDSLVTYGPRWLTFQDHVRAIADSSTVPYVDLNDSLHFRYTEFIDPMHMGAEGRTRWTQALIEQIHRWCPEAGRPAGACR